MPFVLSRQEVFLVSADGKELAAVGVQQREAAAVGLRDSLVDVADKASAKEVLDVVLVPLARRAGEAL